jgi:signal transduction histidine kinase
VHLHTDDAAAPLPPATESSLFRIVQEALTNCAKHAKAKNVTIHLQTSSGRASLTIADDGVGFDPDHRGGQGLGLATMRQRAEFLGGRFELTAAPGRGTQIAVVV